MTAGSAAAQEECFERLDNGSDMSGWHVSATNPHGPGAGWSVEDGAFTGRQTDGNQGGILMTDKSYTDVEVVFEVKIDWGCDSGFFFRTTAGARAYQVTLDHLADSGVGTIWGEGFAQELSVQPYYLTDMGNTAAAMQGETPMFDVNQWPSIWHPADFNEVRARVEGNPPQIEVWISNVKVLDFTDAQLRNEIDPQGPLAIQVHGGSERWIVGGTVQFKNIRVRDLTVECTDPGSGGAGGSGNAAGANGGGANGGGAGAAAAGGAAGSAGSSAGAGAGGGSGATVAMPQAGAASGAQATSANGDDGGCGCALPGARSPGSQTALLLLALGTLLLSRKRSPVE